MSEIVFSHNPNTTGFYIALEDEISIGATNTRAMRTPNEYATVGFMPDVALDIADFLRNPTVMGLRFQAVATAGYDIPHDYMTIRLVNDRVLIAGCNTANPEAKLDLTRDQAALLADGTERLVNTEPMRVEHLRRELDRTFRLEEEFVAAHPTFRDDVRSLIAAKRYGHAEDLFHRTYLAWADAHPVDMAKVASTESGRAAIQTVLDALRKPLDS